MDNGMSFLNSNNVGEQGFIPPVNVVWGQYSELFFLLSAFTYAVAFLFFCWDFATAYRFHKAALAVAVKESEKAEKTVHAEVKSFAVAGIGGVLPPQPGDGGAEPLPEIRKVVGEPRNGGFSAWAAGRRRARIAIALTVLGFTINAAAVCLRGAAAGRVPWGNMYEFCTTGALCVAGVFLALACWKDICFAGPFALGLVLVMLVSATLVFYVPVGHLVPALNSYWIIIHVSLAIIAAALFGIAFVMSALQLLQSWRDKKVKATGKDPLMVMRTVPTAHALEDLAYRINVFAFILWSITIVFGAIWAENAWGRFWGWDPKEVWSFIIWLVYAAYLHARSTRGWTGTRSACLSIIGYCCIVFNFTVVNIFFSGLHSYGGV